MRDARPGRTVRSPTLLSSYARFRLRFRAPSRTPPVVSPLVPCEREQRTNRGRRDVHAHTGQLADDPLIPPAWVLTGNPQHELADVLRRRGSAGTAPQGPPSPNKPAMPTQQRVRADEERLPARSPQKPAGGSQEDTVAVLQTRAGDLLAKNRELVSKHDDLELLELTRTQTQRRHRERTPKQQIHERHEQGQTPSTRMRMSPDSTVAKSAPTCPPLPDGFTHPTGTGDRGRRMSRATAADLLETPGALLSRTHLRELGLERRAVDAVFRQLPRRRPPWLLKAARPRRRLSRLHREAHLQWRQGEAVTACGVCGWPGRHEHRCAVCGERVTMKAADRLSRYCEGGPNEAALSMPAPSYPPSSLTLAATCGGTYFTCIRNR